MQNFRTNQQINNRTFYKVLENNSNYMELGALGPDLPYYESMVKGALDLSERFI